MIRASNIDYNWHIFEQLEQVYCQWHINNSQENLISLTKFYLTQISQTKQTTPIICLAETSADKFLAIFFASIITNSCLFLINPYWQIKEYQQLDNIVKADLFFGNNSDLLAKNRSSVRDNDKYLRFSGIMIPTGGTSGKIKFTIHTWQTLTASAQSFYQYFQEKPINSYCCLPLYHVSGLMQVIRSFISRSKLVVNPYQNLKHNLDSLPAYNDYFISLVPTQLKAILARNYQWLAQFKTVLVGGAATNHQLRELARKQKIRLAITYGMTETASGISILKPEDFLKGNCSNGKILPHAQILINFSEDDCFNQYAQCPTGIIAIKSQSLYKGYYPNLSDVDNYVTDDIGYLNEDKDLYVLGRNSQKIITGGENVFPQEIEAVIGETGLVQDICIVGQKDEYWGEMIIAVYVPINSTILESDIQAMIKTKLVNYKLPKLWYRVAQIPRNAQGKINYQRLSLLWQSTKIANPATQDNK